MAGKLVGLGSCSIGINGLPVGDPCYDPAAFSWWNSDAECACMAAHPDLYSFGQQCASFTPSGIAKAFTYPVGQAAGGLISGATAGAGAGLANQLDFSGYLGMGIIALVAVVVISKVL